MTKKVLSGEEAFALFDEDSSATGGTTNEFTPFKDGSEYIVKVPGLNFIVEYVYGIYKQVNSFIAENPSKKSAKGYPVEDLTPWDLAWKYHKDRSKDWQDKESQEAQKYKCDRKVTIGFYNLDDGEPMKVEFTWNQAQAVVETIKKYEKRLDQFAFELKKTGTGRNTVVSLSLIPVLEDLTETQQKHFKELPNDFDARNFEGLHYVMSDEEQIEKLVQVGFDVSLIGLESPKSEVENEEESGEDSDIENEDLPF